MPKTVGNTGEEGYSQTGYYSYSSEETGEITAEEWETMLYLRYLARRMYRAHLDHYCGQRDLAYSIMELAAEEYAEIGGFDGS